MRLRHTPRPQDISKRGARMLALLALALVAISGTALAVVRISGNPAGVKLFKAEDRALARVHTIRFSESGASWLWEVEGAAPSAHWWWAATSKPAGATPARLQGTLELKDAHVLWTQVTLSPECKSRSGCATIPVTVVSEQSGTFFAFGTDGHHGCYGPATGPFYAPGDDWETTSAHVQHAPKRHGSEDILTYTFPWGRGWTMTESDTIMRATDLPVSAVWVAHADHPRRVVRIHGTQRYGHAQAAPKLNLCRAS